MVIRWLHGGHTAAIRWLHGGYTAATWRLPGDQTAIITWWQRGGYGVVTRLPEAGGHTPLRGRYVIISSHRLIVPQARAQLEAQQHESESRFAQVAAERAAAESALCASLDEAEQQSLKEVKTSSSCRAGPGYRLGGGSAR